MHETNRTISERRNQTYEYVRSYISEKGYAPSVRDIMNAIDVKSTATVHGDLKHLAKEGLINVDIKKSRAITIVPIDATYEDAYEAAKKIALYCSDQPCETCPALQEEGACLLKSIAFGN